MRVLVAVVVVVMCVWGVANGGLTTTTPPHTSPLLSQAQDCVPYGDVGNQEAPSKRFQHRVTVEVTPPAGRSSVTGGVLILKSLTTLRECRLMLVGVVAAVSCYGGHNPGEGGQRVGGQGVRGQLTQKWPMDILAQGEDTELWVQVGGISGAPPDTLVVVGRRAAHQGRLVLPSSGLLPPLTLTTTNLRHYYNCVTGCKYGRSTKTQPGDNTVYLRPDPTFLNLNLAYTTERRDRVDLNLTSDDLGEEAGSSGVREVKVFWDGELGTIGATVDSKRVGDNGRWSRLDGNQEVEAKVEGGGMVAACDHTFLGPVDVEQCEGDEDETDHDESDHVETTTAIQTATTAIQTASTSGVMVALGIMATLALIFLASTIAFACLYYWAWRKLRIITGGSRRVPKRGSTRKRKASNDEDCRSPSEVTAALSDTVMTPAASPGSLSVPRSPVMVSSKEFVSLDLM